MTQSTRLVRPVPERSTVDDLQGRLWQAIEDLRAGRIEAPEANRISAEAQAELRVIEAAMRAARFASRTGKA